MLGKKEKRKSPAGQLNHWECMRQRQKTEKKKRIQNQIKASKQQKMALGKEMGALLFCERTRPKLSAAPSPIQTRPSDEPTR